MAWLKQFACCGFSIDLIRFPPPQVLELERAAFDGSSSACAYIYLYVG
jgi:hypothetical protein